mmetsp:Transcript_24958/g.65512  ORF Transcript_24958/g.65512 Transcript_24958/m.65512 type:complete len:81 (+) Transcript_24958:248-490(+)
MQRLAVVLESSSEEKTQRQHVDNERDTTGRPVMLVPSHSKPHARPYCLMVGAGACYLQGECWEFKWSGVSTPSVTPIRRS